ncbi:prephenate dehydratase [Maricaulis sp.]|uniref:prephenate dehydratase n=1 Tax=Maricaulis sp. TaxID=1486257 RepID=UPI002607B36C|nr:prephenate dehydratase [Maricaulis sp.]
MSGVKSRDEIRAAISDIDRQLIEAIARRSQLVEQILEAKAASGQPVRDREREQAVLREALRQGKEQGVPAELVESLFHNLFEVSIRRQRERFDSMRNEELNEASVAYLGGPGSYSHIAAQKVFERRNATVVPSPKRDFVSIFRSVETGEVDFGVIPIENTTTGSINEVYDILINSRTQIVGEFFLRVDHCLVGRASGQGRVTRVFGHPQALAQCRRYIASHPELETHMAASTTRALERLLEDDDTAAAVAGEDAARLFGMDILARGIGDHEQNITRFIVIARQAKLPTREVECKTSMMFTTRDTAGSLVDALTGFRDNGVNLVKLESRPIAGNPWEEMFIMDVDGHVEDKTLRAAMGVLEEHTREIKLLGCYAADAIDKVSVAE